MQRVSKTGQPAPPASLPADENRCQAGAMLALGDQPQATKPTGIVISGTENRATKIAIGRDAGEPRTNRFT